MSNVIHGKIDHAAINDLVRQYKGQLAKPLQANLRKLRSEIARTLNGEDNVTVYVYISDELEKPIHFQTGAGENQLVINIEEDGIDYTWTKTTFWKKTMDFFYDVVQGIIDGLGSVLKSAVSINGLTRKALK